MKDQDYSEDKTLKSPGYYISGDPQTDETAKDQDSLTMTVVFNNISADPCLQKSWGFAMWIENQEGAVLFDTGSDGNILLENITASGIDLTRLHSIVISHEHWDHVNGLPVITSKLKRQIPIFVPADIEEQIRVLSPGSDIIPVSAPQCITGEIWTTGPLPGNHKGKALSEQSLMINRNGKSYLLTGCSHPGIENIAAFARSHFKDSDLELITGGFHLEALDEREIQSIIDRLLGLKIRKIAPSHCTGDTATKYFQEAWQENFIHLGLGETFVTA